MTLSKQIILNHQDILHKLKRIAYQIYESNVNESELILAGIDANGFVLAEKLKDYLDEISEVKTTLCNVFINKVEPLSLVKTSLKPDLYLNKSVVIVDDVLNSGRTLIYCVKHFLDVPLKQLKTAVLVDRNHKKYPIKVDFKGISLSTSLNEHVEVTLNGTAFEACLE